MFSCFKKSFRTINGQIYKIIGLIHSNCSRRDFSHVWVDNQTFI